MNIETLMSTKERLRILAHIIYQTSPLSVNKVAKDVALSKGLVSKYLDSLTKEGILKRITSKFLVQNNIQSKAVKIFLNINRFDTSIFKRHPFVKTVGLYGSFTKGTNTEHSDIDLWIRTSKTREERLAKLTTELKKHFGNAKPLYLSKEKIQLLKKEDPIFYHSLVFGSIIIYGDDREPL